MANLLKDFALYFISITSPSLYRALSLHNIMGQNFQNEIILYSKQIYLDVLYIKKHLVTPVLIHLQHKINTK